MAAVSYSHEYLTGVVSAAGESPVNLFVAALNHGYTEEHVRALGWAGAKKLLFDTGDDLSLVEPRDLWVEHREMFVSSEVPVVYRVQIFTTSTNLVLSAGDPNGTGVLHQANATIVPLPYYGPNDFAHFPLPFHVPIDIPPIGPIEA